MKRFCFPIVIILLALFGCPNDTADSQSTENGINIDSSSGSIKITKLQAVIDSDEVQNGTLTEIDLSKYPDITNYNAKIDKSVTIKDTKSKDMKGATLQIVSDGVTLSGIKGANVTTQSSMKISGSSLSSLNIAAVFSSGSLSNVEVNGRGDNSGISTTLSGRGSSQPPVVEVDNTEVADDVSVGIANAYLNVKQFTAKKAIELGAANVQLTINDTDTSINEIKTDQVCQVILEDGTSDSIPKPNVSGEGELKQINMNAKGQMNLLAITPMSGLTTVAKRGEAIDFSTVVVLGTYQADDGVTVFKAGGLSYNLTETFSKLEKDFTIKINNQIAYQNNQNVSTFGWASLEAESYKAEIDIDYQYKEESYKTYEFDIVIIGAAENQTEIVMPTFSLIGIDVQKGMAKTEYAEGEPLNLTGLHVTGTWTASVGNISYQNVVTDYTLSPANGTPLTTANTSVTVKAGEFEKTLPITVKSIWSVTFVVDASDDNGTIVLKVVQGKNAAKPNDPTKTGYTFGGWYQKTGETLDDTTYDFSQAVTGNITITAKWTPIEYTISYKGTENAINPNTDVLYTIESDDIALRNATKTGYTFNGWYHNSDKVTKIAKGTSGNIELTAHWTANTYQIKFYANGGSGTMPNQDMTYDMLPTQLQANTFTRTGYTFNGWATTEDGVLFLSDGANVAINLTSQNNATYNLYAIWTPNTNTAYKVEHYQQNANDDEYTLYEVENKTGTTGAETAAAAKIYQHFTASTVTQTAIAADGSTVVRIDYTREIITFTLDLDGGTLGTQTGTVTIQGKYGQSVNAAPTKDGYSLSGWIKSDSTEIVSLPTVYDVPAAYTAVWTSANGITVTISQNSTITVTKVISGDTVTLTAAEGYTDYKWYMDDEEISDNISGDGRTHTLTTTSLLSGAVYQIVLEAKKNGVMYGTQIAVKK